MYGIARLSVPRDAESSLGEWSQGDEFDTLGNADLVVTRRESLADQSLESSHFVFLPGNGRGIPAQWIGDPRRVYQGIVTLSAVVHRL